MSPIKSDLLIIGAGPGGYEMAAEAAAAGLSVTLIERDEFGGNCLNHGCIPTKALCRSAEILEILKNASDFGIAVSEVVTDYGVAVQRKNNIVSQLREGVKSLLANVNVVKGDAEFVAEKTVRVGNATYTADNVVIATGSCPSLLNVVGAELAMTSNELLELTYLPESMVIIGGGVIGIEFASILNAFGVSLTVIEYCKEILPPFDRDIAKRLRQLLSRRGVKFITSAEVKAIHPDMTVEYESKGKTATVGAKSVLMAVGRRPSLPKGIEITGVDVSRKGIVVNEFMQTSVAGLYAIGDVNGLCQLAHAATAQGRVALHHIMCKPSSINLGIVPAAVFTTPELAMVGMTEDACAGLDVTISKAFFRANGKAVTMGETDGIVKMISDKPTGRILGCHIMGPHASDLVQEVAVLMNMGGTVDDLKSSIHGHPTLSEILASVN